MIQIKKEIVTRLRKYESLEDFKELVGVELKNGIILENVVLRNINFKNLNDYISIKDSIELHDNKELHILPFIKRNIYSENRIGIDNIKSIFESPNKIPAELYDLLGTKTGNFTEKENMFQHSFYIFCTKLRNNKNYNFKILKNQDFLELPKKYKFKDFGKIQKHKVFFNSKMYSYFDDKIQRNLSIISFNENAMSFDCYIDMSEHFWRNKTSHLSV
jgi:hypothetical protein